MWYLNFIINQSGVPAFKAGLIADRPAPGYVGRLYISTDTFEIFRDTGSAWDLIGGPGSGSITGTLTANRVAYATGTNTIATSANLLFDGTTLTAVNDIVVNGLTIGRGGGNVIGNTAFGLFALESNATGTANTAIGNAALRNNTTGTSNIAIGTNALLVNNNSFNTAIGSFAIPSATGTRNTAIGGSALVGQQPGDDNVAIGYQAGVLPAPTTGSQNIFIGSICKSFSAAASNQIVIGYNVTGAGDNTVTIGNGAIVNTYLSGTVNVSALVSGSTIIAGGLNAGSSGISTQTSLRLLNATLLLRNAASTQTYGILATSGLIEGNASTETGLFAETGFGINFYTNGSASVVQRISPAANILIGTTTDNLTDKLQVNGTALVNSRLRLGGSYVADISGTGNNTGIAFGGSGIFSCDGSGNFAAKDIGDVSAPWKDIYLSGSVNTGAPSGGTASPIKFGSLVVIAGTGLCNNTYIQCEINGTVVKLATIP